MDGHSYYIQNNEKILSKLKIRILCRKLNSRNSAETPKIPFPALFRAAQLFRILEA